MELITFNFLVLIIVLVSFDTIMKLIALWRAGRNNHLTWFICIAILNTVGILPIIYLIWQKKNKASQKSEVESL